MSMLLASWEGNKNEDFKHKYRIEKRKEDKFHFFEVSTFVFQHHRPINTPPPHQPPPHTLPWSKNIYWNVMPLRNRRASGTFQIIKLVRTKFTESEIGSENSKGERRRGSAEYFGTTAAKRDKTDYRMGIDVQRYVSAGLVSDNSPEMRKR